MSEKILVAGFDRFGSFKRPNRSSELVLPVLEQRYAGLVETLILPTARGIAAKELIAAIQDINPAAVAIFGILTGRHVRLESQAKNRNFNLLIPDNNYVLSVGRIQKGGPKALQSTLPIADLYKRLDDAKVPTRISKHPDTFVCNETAYKALFHNSAQDNNSESIPIGSIHLGNGLSNDLVARASILVADELINSTSLRE